MIPAQVRILMAAVVVWAALAACQDVNGGAVEVSWVLRSQGGYVISACDCAEPAIAKLRLSLVPDGPEPAAAARSYDFPCQRQRAATPFEIPPGNYQLALHALDAQGEVAAGVVTPAPQARTVVWGQPASLDAQLVVAPCAARCANKNGTCRAQ